MTKSSTPTTSRINGAFLVGAGILLSRLAGLVREIVFAHFFGNSDAADVFKAALRIPNFLQNLFGEGALSGSFIPVYAGLRARGRDEDAQKVAGSVFCLLALTVSLLVLIGVCFTDYLVELITPGFEGEKREYVVRLVRVFFPGTGLLVLSAWCLGILNSHRRFFLSYTAPVFWNAAIIAALATFGWSSSQYELAIITCWAATLGCSFQFLVQLPTTLKLLGKLKLKLGLDFGPLRQVVKNFGPVVIGRGVVQIIGYVDAMIASCLPTGALAALMYAQTIFFVPIGLFGVSVSAAELPEMSSAVGAPEEIARSLLNKLASGLKQIAFFVVPTLALFLTCGDLVVGFLYQSGKFTSRDTIYVWATLAGLAPGLLNSALARLCASSFYAMNDTKTPLRAALYRVATASVVGWISALYLPGFLGIDASWGVVGITAAASLSGSVEYNYLSWQLRRRIGDARLPLRYMLILWCAAAAAVLASLLLRLFTRSLPLRLAAPLVLGGFGMVYLIGCYLLGIPEAERLLKRIRVK